MVSDFPVRWVERHRKGLSSVGFSRFLELYDSYGVDAEFDAFATAKGYAVTDTSANADSARLKRTKDYQHLVIKALIAKNLYGNKYYYQVMKDIDDCFKKALEVVAKRD